MEYQVIVIRDFFQQIGEDQELASIIASWMKLKRTGYALKHGKKVLPVSTDDFFGIHIIVCDKSNNEPVLTCKVIPLESCNDYLYKFPLYSIADGLYNSAENKIIENFVHKRVSSGKKLAYSGGWTMNPRYKGLGLTDELKNIFTGLHYHVYNHFKLDTFTGFGAVELGTLDFFKQEWGATAIVEREVQLEFFNKNNCVMIGGDTYDFPLSKHRYAKMVERLWKQRIEYCQHEELAKAV